jgi:hypothetical protein
MIQALDERDIIAGVLTMGTVVIVAILLVFSYGTARQHAGSSVVTRIGASVLTGAIGELFLVGLVILGHRVDLRLIVPSASPELYSLLQFGRDGTQAYVFMLVFGALSAAWGGSRCLPGIVRRSWLA